MFLQQWWVSKWLNLEQRKVARFLHHNEERAKHCRRRRHTPIDQSSESLKSTRILRFTIHHSQLVGLPSLVALGNCFYPDVIWWARTQVYPDGVVGVLNRALAIPNSRACRNSVVIGDWILSLKGTTWWNQRPFIFRSQVLCPQKTFFKTDHTVF